MITKLNLEENTNLLIKAYINLGLAEFKVAFKSAGIGVYLWQKYTLVYRTDLLSFMSYLTIKERKMLIDYIYLNKTRLGK